MCGVKVLTHKDNLWKDNNVIRLDKNVIQAAQESDTSISSKSDSCIKNSRYS